MNNLKYFFSSFILFLNISPINSAEIKMSFGGEIPPYTFPKTNSGIELEVIGAALAYKGHILKPSYHILKQVPEVFKNKIVDAAMTDLGEDLSKEGAYYGNPAVWYDNVIISLKENNLSIKKPEDLGGLIITSFQGAVKRYPKWLKPVKAEYNYFEQNNQQLQVLVLHKERVDLILSDINIYKYNVNKLKKEKNFIAKPIKIHHFIKVNLMNYRPVFRNKEIRDDFNEGLKYIKETGLYQKIYDKYLKN
jgi:polar amino acid transport system substrate-binding protein